MVKYGCPRELGEVLLQDLYITITDTGFYDFSIHHFTSSRVLFAPAKLQDKYESNPVSIGYFYLTRFEPATTGIVSGTFAFDAYNANGDNIHITDGRFDLYF